MDRLKKIGMLYLKFIAYCFILGGLTIAGAVIVRDLFTQEVLWRIILGIFVLGFEIYLFICIVFYTVKDLEKDRVRRELKKRKKKIDKEILELGKKIEKPGTSVFKTKPSTNGSRFS